MKKFILIAFCCLLIASCSTKNDDCSATDPPEQSIQISINDSEGNSLIGDNNRYKPSEMKLYRGSQTIPLIFNEYNGQTYIILYYIDIASDKDYQLKLNAQESEIINLKIKTYNTDCFDELKSVEKFLLNGVEIQRDDVTYNYIIIE